MKQYIVTLLTVFLLGFTVNAQTNLVAFDTSGGISLATNTPAAGKQFGQWEFTLGGGGETIKGESVFGMDFSISTNPFKKLPQVWVGLAQSLYWEPEFAGSSDLFVDWSQAILPSKLDDSLYLNVGWSGGALYDTHELYQWRTGPEIALQYYTSDKAFIFVGANYDAWVSDGPSGSWRYSFGIGLSF